MYLTEENIQGKGRGPKYCAESSYKTIYRAWGTQSTGLGRKKIKCIVQEGVKCT